MYKYGLMTPLEKYQLDLGREDFHSEDAQRETAMKLNQLHADFSKVQNQTGILSKLFPKRHKLKGLYLWGTTGRGKTYLMDSFYECVTAEKKYRTHFHRYMRDIHGQLASLKHVPDPLDVLGNQLAAEYQLLCLDEFQIYDIGDAMILGGLLKALFDNGVTLVTTSNTPIKQLYKNGLQRDRFLFAIDLLQGHTEEVYLGDGVDYRALMLEKNGIYSISEDGNEGFLENYLAAIAPCRPKRNRKLEINDRIVHYKALADDVIWFDFYELCKTHRSAHDYIEVAQVYNTVLISNVAVMNEDNDDVAKRFIDLVDTLYDYKVKLVLTAQKEPEELYQGRNYAFAFERTVSRLHEMRSKEYLCAMRASSLPA
ncbi:MAG: cell division protein ZapE [Gammaproteobacteria bacterium]